MVTRNQEVDDKDIQRNGLGGGNMLYVVVIMVIHRFLDLFAGFFVFWF